MQKYVQILDRVQSYTKRLQNLEADWEQASTNNSNTSSDLEIATEALGSLLDTVDTWRWKLDSMVPGDLGKVARWICQAEQWLKATSRSWYQSVTCSKLIAVSGRHDESWRPSSADPPNSPPSSQKVVQLTEEKNVSTPQSWFSNLRLMVLTAQYCCLSKKQSQDYDLGQVNFYVIRFA